MQTVQYQPSVSSPLSSAFAHRDAPMPASQPRRGPAFPSSRPLRPFASINTSVMANGKPKPGVKLIEPKDTGRQFFVLGLSQSELARR
ncbi:peptide methionine sulfoxide reductase [Ceratobasidium sp. AG-Ba]|nr:peptide methionine sulfoxide reductase [Ceratobasidium sp. AG-Ba]QRW00643.1 peptide methionine sulfoxide reductase [Ceratobasidium sp. AG-Ba]QRW15150.1 peptide methionine sulfoxide reductase [Ceratobasidium sp. AG-Ba]